MPPKAAPKEPTRKVAEKKRPYKDITQTLAAVEEPVTNPGTSSHDSEDDEYVNKKNGKMKPARKQA
jgi:hypothetical protein